MTNEEFINEVTNLIQYYANSEKHALQDRFAYSTPGFIQNRMNEIDERVKPLVEKLSEVSSLLK